MSFRDSLINEEEQDKGNTFGDTLRKIPIEKKPVPTTPKFEDQLQVGSRIANEPSNVSKFMSTIKQFTKPEEPIEPVKPTLTTRTNRYEPVRQTTDVKAKDYYPTGLIGDKLKEPLNRFLTDLGVSKPQKQLAEQTLGAASKVPGLISKDVQQGIREQQEVGFTVPKLVPFVGGKEVGSFDVGRTGTELATMAAQYGAVNKLIEGTALGAKLTSALGGSRLAKFGATQLADLTVDAIVQTPREVLQAVRKKESLGEFAKGYGVNRLVDVAFNAAIGGASEGLKALFKTSDPDVLKAVDDQLKNADDTTRKTIQEELGLTKETTAQDFLKQQENLAKDIEVENYYRQFDKTPEQVLNDFQTWRSKNFGGATGRVSEGDYNALKELYLEDTGIDLDATLRDLNTKINEPDFVKSNTELMNDFYARRTPTPIEPITSQQVKSADIGEIRATEQPKSFKQALTEPVEPVKTEIDVKKDQLFASPRIPDIETPQVGTSKSPFVERMKTVFKSDPTTSKAIRELKVFDELSTTTNEARTQVAKEFINNDIELAKKIVNEGKRFGSGVESEIGRLLVDELQRQGKNAEAVEIISKMSEKFRAAGQDVQAASIWTKTSPEGMQKWAVDTLENADVKVDPDLIKKVGDNMRTIQNSTPEELAKLVTDRLNAKEGSRIEKLINDSYSYDQLKAANTAITMQQVIDKIPVLKARKISSAQALSHLLNFRTFNRNIVGNTASIAGETLSRIPASMADRAISLYTGNRSVIAGSPKFKEAFREAKNQATRSATEILLGVGRGKTGKYETLFGSAFNSKIGKGLEKTLSLSLQTPDEFFKGYVKADSLYNQLQARLGKQVKNWDLAKIIDNATETEIQTALKEAEFATFQNDSFLADVLSKSKKGLNGLSTEAAKRVPGMKNLFTEEFGLGDMVVKYTKVPGNIITRGFEYSPLGYLKAGEGIFNMMKSIDDMPVELQRELAMQIGRATTGTGLLLTGKALYDNGIITGVEQSKDYDVGAFDRAEGLGEYKVNLSALQRLIKGQSTEPQAGDNLINYNWAVPMTTPIAVGARIAAEGGLKNTTPKDLALGTFEEAVDLPTLYTVKQMFYESMKEGSTPIDVMSVPLKEALPGFVPSIVRQTAQTIDPTIRDTSGGANVPVLEQLTPLLGESVTGKIQANIPGLSQQLLPRLDPLGREQERAKGIFANLISPATQTTYTPTEFGNKLRQIEEFTGDTSIYPDRKAPNYTTFNKEKFELSTQDKQRWQQIEGQTIEKLYNELLSDTIITKDNAEPLIDIIKSIKRTASEQAKYDFLERRK